MNIDLKNKKVLVTGGTRGIGSAIAQCFLKAGADVTVTGTSDKNRPHDVRFIQVDFSHLTSTLKFVQNPDLQKFDVLINNAGINKIDSLNKIALEDWQKIQDVNLRAPFLVSQAVARGMSQRSWGRIVNISSIFGVVTREQRLSYTASKAGLIGMTKTLALELASKNILVNSVSPGFIDTELTRNILGEAEVKKIVSLVPLQKLGTPDDVAHLVLFLASDLNRFLTGENVVIDGGFTCA